MKLREEFRIGRPVAEVWSFFDQPEQVASCMPGVEKVTVTGPDDIDVRVTQSVGPMSATFATSLEIIERVPEKLIAFNATGKTVRGAMGNVRASVTVELEAAEDSTTVVVGGDVALAGALGSVGQKVVSKQAGKMTAAFARNLERALGGQPPERAVPVPLSASDPAVSQAVPADRSVVDEPAAAAAERWAKVAAALSAASVAIGLVALGRSMERGRR